MRRGFRLSELIERLGGQRHGPDVMIEQVASLEAAGRRDIAYFGRAAFRDALRTSNAGAFILARIEPSIGDRPCIIAENPHAYFVRVATLLNPLPVVRPGVHALADVHADAHVSAEAEVGAFVSIGPGAHIAAGARIGPGCRVGAGAIVGEDSRLYANVVIYERCIVGKRCVLNAGCVIGGDGFGGALENEQWLKMPHLGRVVLGDDVEIGANTTIDRGALTDTVLADGVKLDNQIQIGHNVRIGAHTSIAACVGIAGSTQIGAHCVIGGAAMITGHITIADRTQVSAGTFIAKSIDRPGRYTGIYPASEHRAWMRGAVELRKLAEAKRASKSAAAPRTKPGDE